MQDGRSLRQLTMEIAQPLMVDGPIAGVESFDHHGDEEDEPLQVPVDSDSGSEGSDGEAPPMTDNQPSEARPAMSDSQNHPRHYSYLNLDAMPQSIYAGGRGTAGNILYNAGEEELHIGQQFPNKDAVLFAVKNYSIRRSVEYKVLESDQLTYHGKCKHFGNGCSGVYALHIIGKRSGGKFGSTMAHTRVCPLPFPRIIRSWTRMLYVRPYFPWYRLIRRYPLKCCKDRWRRDMVSRLRTGRYGWQSKRLLLRFMAIGKRRIMSFRDGYKLCRCLCQVP